MLTPKWAPLPLLELTDWPEEPPPWCDYPPSTLDEVSSCNLAAAFVLHQGDLKKAVRATPTLIGESKAKLRRRLKDVEKRWPGALQGCPWTSIMMCECAAHFGGFELPDVGTDSSVMTRLLEYARAVQSSAPAAGGI